MGRDSTWTNDDGLVVGFGTRTSSNDQGGNVRTSGLEEEYVIEVLDGTAIGATDTAAVTGGDYADIPANSVITAAYFQVDTAFTSAGAATLDIGLKQRDGTEVGGSDDVIDAAIALTAIDAAGETVACDGSYIGASVGANPVVPKFTYGTATFTAGAGKLVIKYLRPAA